ncbi:hypothetical protein L1987_49060 [Smallanthus sonchifolius]|uniref:Uncharacterized protein n=1 Tax=Smallanthus sonchifolius TaxID=185202 RepID=A0ACB9FTP6_9ASTR|nr:hypothetical protein L1987_49060 [Smallanthus sonchifolius]
MMFTKDNITTGEFIIDGLGYLESPGMKFRMGFFPHGNGNTSEVRRYVGIWYTMDPKTVVWVANRDTPTLEFLLLQKMVMEGAPLTALKLLDTGNAVLTNVASGSILWQSFATPTDTFLPGMIMGTDMTLTSWKSITDPGSGSFEFQPESGIRLAVKHHQKRRKIILRNGTRSSEPYMAVDPNSRLVMGHSGKLQYLTWSEVKNQWVSEWEEPKDTCSYYRVCGPFGMCEKNNDSSCTCLSGFEPISPYDPTDGCRRISKTCDKSTKDTFINITMISMDDTTVPILETSNELECIKECLKNCKCLAYSYSSQKEGGIQDPIRKSKQGCWFWDTEPNNLRGEGTHTISFRVSESSKGTFSGTSSCCVDCMLNVLAFHSVCTLHLSLKKKSLRDDHFY